MRGVVQRGQHTAFGTPRLWVQIPPPRLHFDLTRCHNGARLGGRKGVITVTNIVPPEYQRLNLRLPASLFDEVRALAERDHRSMNGEIVFLLEQAILLRKQVPDMLDVVVRLRDEE